MSFEPLGNCSATASMRVTRKPNLFIIGSMKSGTTYLFNLLSSHPSIFMCHPKEPSYFVNPNELRQLSPRFWKEGYWESQENYLRLFQLAGTAKIVGEGSVYYSHLPFASGVPERIRQFNPDARLIYVMRDPIERTMSHYWHRVRWNGEHRPIADAVKNCPWYRDVSYYAMQLLPYFECFGRDQIKLVVFEEMISKTSEVIRSICRWLNLGDDWLPTLNHQPLNVTPEKVAQSNAVLHQLLQKNDVFHLAYHSLPRSVRKIGGRILKRKREINRLNVDTSEVVQFLRPLQRRQTQELTQLIGREFPEWTTLNPRDMKPTEVVPADGVHFI
jgi:Sulfotransferase family